MRIWLKQTFPRLVKIKGFLFGPVYRWRQNRRFSKKQMSGKFWKKGNPDKQFYILRRRDDTVGIGSLINVFLSQLAHMESSFPDAIPVVDLQHYPNALVPRKSRGKINAWTWFFDQPGGYSLEEALASKVVYLSDGMQQSERWHLGLPVQEQMRWQRLYTQYFHLSRSMQDRVEQCQKDIFVKGERVVGILCRGTDYISLQPKNHPVQPSPQQMLEKVCEVMEQQKCTSVYLVTEDASIALFFSQALGERLKLQDIPRMEEEPGKLLCDSGQYQEIGARQVTSNYIVDLYMLAQCTCFVAGNTSGSCLVPLIATTPFEYQYIWDLGRYR